MSTATAPRTTLSASQIQEYHDNGYIVLRQVFAADEVAAWHEECNRLLSLFDIMHEDNLRTRFRKYPDGTWRLEKYDPVVGVSPVFSAVANDERILGPVRDLFADEPRLFKDKLIFKSPGQGGYSLHQDFTWWQPFPGGSLLSVMVAIDGANAENGAMEVFAGYHDRHLTPAGELRGINEEEARQLDPARAELVETEPGDMLIFSALTPHRSGANNATHSRRQFFPSYSAARCGDLYDAHYKHYREYVLQGLKEDDRARLFFR